MEDELRPVTALFVDIVGSTALGERLLPEEVKALVGECVTHVSGAVEEFGGTIQAYQGDGICAYFAVPAAHADDAERAARAALRIVEIVGSYCEDIRAPWGIERFNVRVGINSGPAASGRSAWRHHRQSRSGIRPTSPHGSRRPPSLGPCSSATAPRSCSSAGSCSRSASRLRSRVAPVQRAWRLLHARPADHSGALTPTVGRDGELARLRDAVAELARGRGQIVLMSGEDGLGKSRLVAELSREAGELTHLEGHCPSYGGAALYRPFIEILREWLGVADGDAEIARHEGARASARCFVRVCSRHRRR